MTFQVHIRAPRERVWEVLWSDAGYRQWTSVFAEGSHAVTDWQEGSPVQFLDGKGRGMHALISKRIDHEQMSFTHQGAIVEGRPTTAEWAGAREEYFLQSMDGGTQLRVQLDSNGEMDAYMRDTFPKALQKLKELAETGN